jgi:parallel beta-helix repeat protein
MGIRANVNGTGVRVVDNTVRNATLTVTPTVPATPPISTVRVAGNTVTGGRIHLNVLNDSVNDSAFTPSAPTGPYDITVTDNRQRGGSSGIHLQGSEIEVRNNTVRDNEDAGIVSFGENLIAGNNATGNREGIRTSFRDRHNTTIRNNTVRENEVYGIFLNEGNNTARNNTVVDNSHGIAALSSGHNRIVANHVRENRLTGVFVGIDRILPFQGYGDHNRLADNVIRGTDGPGVVLEAANRTTVRNNTLAGNTGPGVLLNGSSHNRLLNNTVRENDGDGIALRRENFSSLSLLFPDGDTNRGATVDNRLANNTAINNVGAGVSLNRTNRTTVRGNTARNNSDGLLIANASGGRTSLARNVLAGNRRAGLHLRNVSNRTVVGDRIVNNTGMGVLIEYAPGMKLEDTTLSGNGRGAVVRESPRAELRDITITGSPRAGIELDGAPRSILEDVTVVSGTGTGIVIERSNRSRVLSGEVRGSGAGIRARSSANLTVRGMTIRNTSGDGITIVGGESGLVRGSTVIENGGRGIHVLDADRAHIEESNVSANDGRGIVLEAANDSRLRGIEARANAEGVFFLNATGVTVRDSSLVANDDRGIHAIRADRVFVADTTVADNGFDGITLIESDHGVLRGNDVKESDNGIIIQRSTGLTIQDNDIRENQFDGIRLVDAPSNVVIGNRVRRNRGDGVKIDDADGNALLRNTVAGNGATGIHVDPSDDTRLVGNVLRNNDEWEYRATGGSSNTTIRNLTMASIRNASLRGKNVALNAVEPFPAPPAGERSTGQALEVSATGPGAWLAIRVNYTEVNVSNINESTLSLWRYDGSTWSGVTDGNSVDTTRNVISANVTTFGVLAVLGEPDDTTPPMVVNASVTDAVNGDGTVSDGEQIEVSADVSDSGTSVDTVTANASAFGAGRITLTDGDDDGVYRGTFTVDEENASATGNQTVTIEATDTAGNVQTANTNSLELVETTTVSIPETIDADGNGVIGDFEILEAIRLWRTGEKVPNTGGKTISDFKVLDLISTWRQGASVGS